MPLLGLFLLGYAQAGLYPGFGLGPVEILRRSSLVTATGFLALAAVSFAFKLPYLFSRVTFALAFLLALLASLVLFAGGARIGHFILLGVVAIPVLWNQVAGANYRLKRVVADQALNLQVLKDLLGNKL